MVQPATSDVASCTDLGVPRTVVGNVIRPHVMRLLFDDGVVRVVQYVTAPRRDLGDRSIADVFVDGEVDVAVRLIRMAGDQSGRHLPRVVPAGCAPRGSPVPGGASTGSIRRLELGGIRDAPPPVRSTVGTLSASVRGQPLRQATLEALGLDDRINTGRVDQPGPAGDPLLDVWQSLSDAVFDWWNGTPPALVYRTRTVPNARSMAFGVSAGVDVVSVRQVREARRLLAALIGRHRFIVP